MHENAPRQNYYEGGEIDLFEVFSAAWKKKWLIVGIAGIALLIGLLYALLAPRSFLATVQVGPPDWADLSIVNEKEIFEIEPGVAFQRGLAALGSPEVHSMTFNGLEKDIAGLSSGRQSWSWRTFSQRITVTLPRGSQPWDYATVGFKDSEKEFAALALGSLIRTANAEVAKTLSQEFRYKLETKISALEQSIEQEVEIEKQASIDRIARLEEVLALTRSKLQGRIDTVRAKNRQLRLDRLAALEEALTIARKLHIEEPVLEPEPNNRATFEGVSPSLPASSTMAATPLYLLGSRALEAEINALRARETDDFTSSEVRELEAQLAQLDHNQYVESLRAHLNNPLDTRQVTAMRVEAEHLKRHLEQDLSGIRVLNPTDEITVTPTGPKTAVILLLSALGGGFLGILVALLSHGVSRRETPGQTGA